ncbi:MAG: 50S ribosomal protein L33 [Alphaproteobacteria bacterium]|nr:50S ribosomal protein L33 [Rickettsiales bacterium]
MSQKSSYQNYMLASTEGGNGHAYYKRKGGKGLKSSVTTKLRKYNKILRKHVLYTQKKIVWRAN